MDYDQIKDIAKAFVELAKALNDDNPNPLDLVNCVNDDGGFFATTSIYARVYYEIEKLI